jgi:hypothetical protein
MGCRCFASPWLSIVRRAVTIHRPRQPIHALIGSTLHVVDFSRVPAWRTAGDADLAQRATDMASAVRTR